MAPTVYGGRVTDEQRPYGSDSADPALKRVRTRHFQRAKQQGIKITGLTSYDFLSASIFDDAGIDFLLVGDSGQMPSFSHGGGASDPTYVLLAGSDVVHLCYALLNNGPEEIDRIKTGVGEWMEQHGFEQLSDFRGSLSQVNVQDPAEYERLNYIRVLGSYDSPGGVWR